jgi:hypothetical protein
MMTNIKQKRRPVAEGMDLFVGSEIGNTMELISHLCKKCQEFLAGSRETKQVNGSRLLT